MLSMSLEPDPFKMQSFLGLGHSPDTWSVARHVFPFFHSWQCLVLLAQSPWNQIIIWVAKFNLCHPGTGWIDPLSFCGFFCLSGLCAQSWSRPQSVQPASGQWMPFKFSFKMLHQSYEKTNWALSSDVNRKWSVRSEMLSSDGYLWTQGWLFIVVLYIKQIWSISVNIY